jgi:hypothetical protein
VRDFNAPSGVWAQLMAPLLRQSLVDKNAWGSGLMCEPFVRWLCAAEAWSSHTAAMAVDGRFAGQRPPLATTHALANTRFTLFPFVIDFAQSLVPSGCDVWDDSSPRAAPVHGPFLDSRSQPPSAQQASTRATAGTSAATGAGVLAGTTVTTATTATVMAPGVGAVPSIGALAQTGAAIRYVQPR